MNTKDSKLANYTEVKHLNEIRMSTKLSQAKIRRIIDSTRVSHSSQKLANSDLNED
jgi:hypothetical protein